ncbi:MAG: hypothetical protein IPG60_11240 [Bacteroidetes bacterium]|nr:hypothetical protein [Bacteroidota bacterium]
MMKDFQSQGLFGARDVSKKFLTFTILSLMNKMKNIYALQNLAKKHKKVASFLKGIDKTKKVEGLTLGKLRLDIKNI